MKKSTGNARKPKYKPKGGNNVLKCPECGVSLIMIQYICYFTFQYKTCSMGSFRYHLKFHHEKTMGEVSTAQKVNLVHLSIAGQSLFPLWLWIWIAGMGNTPGDFVSFVIYSVISEFLVQYCTLQDHRKGQASTSNDSQMRTVWGKPTNSTLDGIFSWKDLIVAFSFTQRQLAHTSSICESATNWV